MRKNKYALLDEQFAALREKLNQRTGKERFLDKNVDAAYAVMVKNESVMAVAEAAGMGQQNLYRIVRDLWIIATDSPKHRPCRRSKRKVQTNPAYIVFPMNLPVMSVLERQRASRPETRVNWRSSNISA